MSAYFLARVIALISGATPSSGWMISSIRGDALVKGTDQGGSL